MYGFRNHLLSGARGRGPRGTRGDQRRPGNAPHAFVNGLNVVDGPGGIRDGPQVLEGWAKSGIDLTVTDRGRTPGGGRRRRPGNGPSALVYGSNDIDLTV
jgi:hypothetical protein